MATPASSTEQTAVQPTIKLTLEQIQFFHREGYLVLDSISTPDEIERLKVAYDRIFAEHAGRDRGDQFDLGGTDEEGKQAALPQILGPLKYAPELKNGLFRVNAEAIAHQLLGSQARFSGDHAILKPAKYGAETPWHQDEAYWDPHWIYDNFSLWMPLQDTSIEMGCMWFVPKTQRLEVLPHRSINNDPRIHGLEMVNPPSMDQAVACPIPAGGCTIHNCRTLHYAGPNKTDTPRRAYIIGFSSPPVKYPVPRSFPWEEQKQTARAQRAQKAEGGKEAAYAGEAKA